MATKIEVAKLFSSMGFEIDTTQLEKFEQLTRNVRASTVKLARDLRQTNSQLTSVSSKLKSVNQGLNSVNSRKGAANLSQSYASLSRNVNVAQTSLNRISTTLSTVEPKLNTQITTVNRLSQAWKEYSDRIKESNERFRDRPTGQPARPPSGSGGNHYNSGGRPSGSNGAAAGLLGGIAGRFAGNFAPQAALAGGAVTAGYAVKEVVQVGREYQKMKQTLLASSETQADFNRHLAYAEKVTNRLGTNVIEFGSAYAKTLQASKGKLSIDQTEKIFEQFSELMVVLGSSDDDQKGVFRAMSQMFSKGKIQMEEINQMAERNVPALAMMTRAYKELGMTSAEFEKAQREGKLDPTKFIPLFGKYASEFARNNDALKKAMESSVTQQGIFMNQMRKMANQIMEAGLDEALGNMFKALTKLGTVLTPLVIKITQATLGFIDFIKVLGKFASEHPVIFAALAGIVGYFVAMRVAMRAGITMGGLLFVSLVNGLRALKIAMIKTAVLAIFIGIAEILVSLYEHMNGNNNWLSVTINWFEILGQKIKGVMLDFNMLVSALTRGLKDSWVGQFFEKIFSFDFSNAFRRSKEASDMGGEPSYLNQGRGLASQTPQQQQAAQRLAQYTNNTPVKANNQIYGNMNVGYKLEIVNGKQVFTQHGTQKVVLGGLKN